MVKRTVFIASVLTLSLAISVITAAKAESMPFLLLGEKERFNWSAGTYLGAVQEKSADAKDTILEKAREGLTSYYSSGKYRFDLAPRWIPQSLLHLESENILSVELRGEVRRYTDFEVLYRNRGNREKASIQLTVKVEQQIPVVSRRISRGEVIKEEDLQERWVSLMRNKGDLMEDINAMKGKTLRRTLLAGQPVRKSYVSREYIIEAGDRVKLIIEKQGIQVQLVGEAREPGAKGDKIRIYSEETRKKYKGEVISPGVTKWKNTL